MTFELRLVPTLRRSVKARVIEELEQFPATVRELSSAGCGHPGSIRRVLRALAVDGGLARLPGHRYMLRSPLAAYKVLP
jgi:hypothetical protein